MSAVRLTCSVSVPTGADFPQAESHPFWTGLEELAEAIAQFAEERGLDPDQLGFGSESEDGTLLVQSSDAPRDVVYFWVWLPHAAEAQAALLPTILDHLAQMRSALQGAHWHVELNERPLVWDGGRFHLAS